MGEYLTHIFDFFFRKKTPLTSEFLLSMNRMVLKSSLHMRLRLIFLTHKVMALEIVKNLIFDSFVNISDFSRKLTTQNLILCSMDIVGSKMLPCISVATHSFSRQKVIVFGKDDFLSVFFLIL